MITSTFWNVMNNELDLDPPVIISKEVLWLVYSRCFSDMCIELKCIGWPLWHHQQCNVTNTHAYQEFHQTCHSVTVYFMKKKKTDFLILAERSFYQIWLEWNSCDFSGPSEQCNCEVRIKLREKIIGKYSWDVSQTPCKKPDENTMF